MINIDSAESQDFQRQIPDLEQSDIGRYKETIRHLITLVKGRPNWIEGNIEGTHGDVTFVARDPYLRRGKHASVYIVELSDSQGNSASCVLRSRIEDAKRYLEVLAQYPVIEGMVPALYGIVEKWVVMERLTGLELSELQVKLAENPDFQRKYVQKAFELITRTAQDGLRFDDVAFVDGHNTTADPETADIRIIEQTALYPDRVHSPNEIITDKLFSEVYQITHKKPEEENEQKFQFAFGLLQLAFAHFNPSELYVRSRKIKPTHPGYKEAWWWQNQHLWFKPGGGRLSDEEHQRILSDPNLRENFTVNYSGAGFTEIFSDEMIEAVKAEDYTKFKELVVGRAYKTNVTNTSDSRDGPIVLPDNVSF